MRCILTGIARDGNGNIVPSATITPFLYGTSTATSIYTTLTGATAVNSVTAGADGSFTFYVDRFDYDRDQCFDIQISKTSGGHTWTEWTWTNVDIRDVVLGTYSIADDKTVSTDLGLVPKGVLYQIATGKTLTFSNKHPEAGHYQIFNCVGTGAVAGLDYVETIWFGTTGDGVADDRIPIQKAFSAIADHGHIFINPGTYSIVNASGTGATNVIKRAAAVAAGTLYPLTLSANYVTLEIAGDLTATTLLDDLITVSGDHVKVIGKGGSLTGSGEFLDTNSEDPTLQWLPSLISFSGDYGEVSGLLVINPPTRGIAGGAVGNAVATITGMNVHDNIVYGGNSSHSSTVSFAIAFQGSGTSYCKATHNLIMPNATGGMMYDGIFNLSTHAVLSDNTFEDSYEHAIYNYGAYSVMADNNINGSASMTASAIQSFADNVSITGNNMNHVTAGIGVKLARDSIISNNVIAVSGKGGGIAATSYTGDLKTSGTLTPGYEYMIVAYVAGDDFANVGGNNTTGGYFVATGTTPTTWTNSSQLVRMYGNLSITDNVITVDPTVGANTCGIQVSWQYGGKNVNVSDNIIEGAGGTTADNVALVVRARTANVLLDNAIISNNIIRNSYGLALNTDYVHCSTISGNEIINFNSSASAGMIALYPLHTTSTSILYNKIASPAAAVTAYAIYLGTGTNYTTIKGNEVYGFTNIYNITGTVYGESMNVPIGTIAAASDAEIPVMSVSSSPSGIVLLEGVLTNGANITQSDTDYDTFSIMNRGTDGSGTNAISSINTKVTGGSALTAYDSLSMGAVSATYKVLPNGSVVTFKKAHSGSGAGTTGMLVTLRYVEY